MNTNETIIALTLKFAQRQKEEEEAYLKCFSETDEYYIHQGMCDAFEEVIETLENWKGENHE